MNYAFAVGLLCIGAAAVSPAPLAAGELEVVPIEQVQWGHLNPLRGDQSPGAADLWGDRTGAGATGMLVRFADGFASPPHIHNVSYRGVVLRGRLHNDDPDAARQWLPPGSFWTQPAGESHITAASGSANLAYIEIDSGPYLVHPSKEAFDNGERAVNVDHSNLVWLGSEDLRWIATDAPESTDGPALAALWGNTAPGRSRGVMLRLPVGFAGAISSAAKEFRAVLVQGGLIHGDAVDAAQALRVGSYLGSTGQQRHRLRVTGDVPALLYIRSSDRFSVSDQKGSQL